MVPLGQALDCLGHALPVGGYPSVGITCTRYCSTAGRLRVAGSCVTSLGVRVAGRNDSIRQTSGAALRRAALAETAIGVLLAAVIRSRASGDAAMGTRSPGRGRPSRGACVHLRGDVVDRRSGWRDTAAPAARSRRAGRRSRVGQRCLDRRTVGRVDRYPVERTAHAWASAVGAITRSGAARGCGPASRPAPPESYRPPRAAPTCGAATTRRPAPTLNSSSVDLMSSETMRCGCARDGHGVAGGV